MEKFNFLKSKNKKIENQNATENNTDNQEKIEQNNVTNNTKQFSLEESIQQLEKYVNENQTKVFKYTLGGLSLLIITFLLLSIIPNDLNNVKSDKLVDHEHIENLNKKSQEILKKTAVKEKLKLETIPSKYTEEQTLKYILFVEKYIDKYKGEQNLYTNVLEFISDNCVNPINQNTNLLVKSLSKKMNEHDRYFDENNKIIKGLTNHCIPPEEKYELPADLGQYRGEYLRIKYNLDRRYLEIEQIQLKHGKENVNPVTGDLTLNFISEDVLKEQEERKNRFRMEDLQFENVKGNIVNSLERILHKNTDNNGLLIIATIMRDYGKDFSFFYDYYAKRNGNEKANQLKTTVEQIIEHNKQLKASSK